MIENELTNKYIVSKSVHSYVFLAILTIVSLGVSYVIDAIIIGTFLGGDALASFGISEPITLILSIFAIIFSSGGGVSYSNYAGRGEKQKINNNFTIIFLFSLLIGAIITLFSPLYITPLTQLVGASGTLIETTSAYIAGFFIGAIPLILFEVLLVYTRLEGVNYLEIVAGGAIIVTNIILDILFVTVFHMGIFGIGLATAIGFTIADIILMKKVLSKQNSLGFCKIKDIVPEIKSMTFFGLPSGLSEFYNIIRIFITNHLAMFIGGAVLMSTMSILIEINALTFSVNLGFGAITLLLGGIFYGERDKKSLQDVLNVTLKSGVILTIILAIVIIILAPQIATVFIQEEEIVLKTITSLRIFALSIPLSLITVIFLNFYNSTKNSFIANYLGFARGFLFISIFAVILTPFIGEYAIWSCFTLGEIITLIGLLIIIKIKTGKFPRKLIDFILLNDDFEKDIISTLNITIKNDMKEVMELSNKIYNFGEKYFDDISTANKVSLCIEEMVGNIVEHGYEKDKKSKKNKTHYIDIRIIKTINHTIFRIRDDGTPFSPIDYADENEPTEKNVGIRMIQAIAENMEYRSTIGLNNLTITI